MAYYVIIHCMYHVPPVWKLYDFTVSHPVVNKEWSNDDSRWKRSVPSRKRDHLVYKRQGDVPTGPPTDDSCCVNGTKGEKGTQGY